MLIYRKYDLKKILNKFIYLYNLFLIKLYIFYKNLFFVDNTNSLESIGFTKIKDINLSEYILAEYKKFKLQLPSEINFNQLDANLDCRFQYYSIKHENIKILKAIFTDELFLILKKFFKKNFFVRGNIQLACYQGQFNNGTEELHIDSEYAVNLMINLTDCTSDSIHMEFFESSGCSSPNKLTSTAKIHKTIGPENSSFLFAAGRNYHRRVSGNSRIVLILSFVPIRLSRVKILLDHSEYSNALFFTQNNFELNKFCDDSDHWRLENFNLN